MIEYTHCANPKCGKELTHIEGRKKKKYCNSYCKLRHWQELNPVKKQQKTKRIPLDKWADIEKKIKILDATEQTNTVKPQESLGSKRSNYVIDTTATKSESEIKIEELEKEISTLGTTPLANQRRRFLQGKIYELRTSK